MKIINLEEQKNAVLAQHKRVNRLVKKIATACFILFTPLFISSLFLFTTLPTLVPSVLGIMLQATLGTLAVGTGLACLGIHIVNDIKKSNKIKELDFKITNELNKKIQQEFEEEIIKYEDLNDQFLAENNDIKTKFEDRKKVKLEKKEQQNEDALTK